MARGYQPKRRNSNDRKRHPIFVFALEGDNKTERLYLQQIARELKGKINFHYAEGNETDPVAMMKALIEKAEQLEMTEGDFGFCLVDSDCDPSKNQLMGNADKLAQDSTIGRIQQIVSSPCFEIWYLLHYTYSTALYNRSSEVIDKLREQGCDYQKNKAGMFDRLRENHQKACENARRLMKHCSDKGAKLHTTAYMPSTEVFLIFEHISRICGHEFP